MESKLQIAIKESGLTNNRVKELISSFGQDFQEAQRIANDPKSQIVITSEDQLEEMSQAREQRLALKNIRVRVENTRKELKEQSLREGKAIDGAANIIKALIIPVEEHLEKQEKYVELIQAEKRAKKIQARIEELSKYVDDVSLYKLDEMSNETFDKLLESSKKAYFAQKEAEKKAEEERIAKEKKEAAEREQIRIENEKLRKEAAIKEEALKKERQARELAERKVQEERAIAERVKRDQEAKIAREKAEEEARIAREKAEAEEKERQAKLAPDKEKMRVFYKKLADLRTELGGIKFTEQKTQNAANEIYTDLGTVMTKIVIKMKTL